MTIQLYEDQQQFVDLIRGELRQRKTSVLGVASPAFGKTVVAAYITQQSLQRGNSCWFLVHRKNLLRQTSKSFWQSDIEHGLITSGKRRSVLPVQVGTIGSAYSRLATLTPPNVLFIDEAHLAKGNMFETVINWARDGGSIIIGLTGTPERLDGQALGDVFDSMVEAITTRQLIDSGRLSKYDIYSTPVQPDLSHVKKSGNDHNREQLGEAMDKPAITGDAVEHWLKLAKGKRTVCYCVNVKHSQHTSAAFNAAGIPAVHVDASTTEAELKDACEGLADRRYLVLCNCELVIEGFDLSSQVSRDVTLECCILLRPTQSLARYLQMVFRALRKKPEPAIILDHAGCAVKHGLPCDERVWSLEGKKRGTRQASDPDDINIKQCQSCWYVFQAGPECCPKCGAAVQLSPREIEVIEGELQKIEIEKQRREEKRERGNARTLEELAQLGKQRGYKPGWAAQLFARRQGRKPTPQEIQLAKEYSTNA